MNALTNTFLVVVALTEWPFKVLVLSVTINGTSLYTNVKDATRTGCRWSMEFSMVVLKTSTFRPWHRPVTLITRTVPPFSRLTNTIKVIRVQTPPLKFVSRRKKQELKTFVGNESTMGKGSNRSLHRVVSNKQINSR